MVEKKRRNRMRRYGPTQRTLEAYGPARRALNEEEKKHYERLSARFRFNNRHHIRFWRASANVLAKSLMDAFAATEEPVFLEAYQLLAVYDCVDGTRSSAKRLKHLDTLSDMARPLASLDEELQAQHDAGKRRSLRRAMISVIERGLVDAPTEQDAALKRLQRAYKARATGRLPTGDTGHVMLIARIDTFVPDGSGGYTCTVRDVRCLPDDRRTRQSLFFGEEHGGRWVKLGYVFPTPNGYALPSVDYMPATANVTHRASIPFPRADRIGSFLLRAGLRYYRT
jgi:hypothetical protein